MPAPELLRVRIYVDGGARGNPGPAAAGAIITAEDGTVLYSAGIYLGCATNNVAEYSALVSGLRKALELGAAEAEVISDSELVVKQIVGDYRVRNDGLKPFYRQAQELAGKLERFAIRHVPRKQNREADKLVNRAIDASCNVEDAAE